MRFGIDRKDVPVCEITVTNGVSIRIQTQGSKEVWGRRAEWDISFEGTVYENTWPMRKRWSGRW